MNTVEVALRRAVADLTDFGIPFALAGGLAVSARAQPRFTRDVDLALAVATDAAVEELIHALRERGYRLVSLVEQENVGRLGAARMTCSAAPSVMIDLLFASCGLEPEIAAAAEPLEIVPSLRVPVARTGHLVAMKLLASDDLRPQDAADLLALSAVLHPSEHEDLRTAAALIQERGFHRDRDLPALAEAYLRGSNPV